MKRGSTTRVGPSMEDPTLGLLRKPRVLVVGGGVSGCACAATLATAGLFVVVMNSALDTVGQPSFGPDIVAPSRSWAEVEEVLGQLAAPLRDAWVGAATACDEAWPYAAVDRRMLSVESKRALEGIDGLEFRQGLVVDVRVIPAADGSGQVALEGEGVARKGPRVAVETAFGELVEADVVVLAVGLGLAGSVAVGDDVLPGGRYGETPAPGLRESVERLGVTWRRVHQQVGPRYAGREDHRGPGSRRPRPIRELSGGGLRMSMGRAMTALLGRRGGESVTCEGDESSLDCDGSLDVQGCSWPANYPPAPHWEESLRSREFGWWDGERPAAGVADTLSDHGASPRIPCLSPDGAATGEVYLRPGCCGLEDALADATPSRLSQEISGLVVDNLDENGRLVSDALGQPHVWVVGRAGGAADYLESLASGTRAARDIVGRLGGEAWTAAASGCEDAT